MAAIIIPTNYSWLHLDRFGSRGPSMLDFATAITEDFAALNVRVASNQAALDALVAQFNAHRGSAGIHLEADTTNVIAAPSATDVTVDILALINNAALMLTQHMAQIAAIHPGGADATNALAATYPATTEAEGVALINDVKAKYNLHRANNGGAYHTNPDATNTVGEADATDWDSCITLANAYKDTTGFNQHVVLTAGPTHGASGAVDLITAADSGVQKTAAELEINEFKTDFNAHIASAFVHPNAGTANGTAAATTEATSVALINGLKATLNTHMAAADDHLDADTVTIALADATEYEDLTPLVVAVRAAFLLHAAKSAVHAKADAANAGVALGTGGAVTIKTVMGSVDT